MIILKKRLTYFTGVSILALVLTACGGSDGGTLPGGESGMMAVLITDAPSDEFEQINLTLLEVELLGDGAPVTLHEDERRINLLDLTHHSEMLAAVDVPAGEYNKIRLRIEDVELVRPNGTTETAKTTGNGKLDLNPRGPFTVTAGELLVVQLDMDANKSIKLTGTGSGNYLMRPVVFVDVLSGAVSGKLLRLEGEVAQVAPEVGEILLCDIDLALIDPGGTLGSEDEQCIVVVTASNTPVFDSSGEWIVLGQVEVGSHMAALGRLSLDEGEDLVLNALVLEVAPAGVYQRFSGRVENLDVTNLTFSLDGVYTVEASVSTKLLNRDGVQVSWDSLANGDEVKVEAVASGDVLFPAVIFVDAAADEVEISGTVGSIDFQDDTFELLSEGLTHCVVVTSATTVLAVGEDGGGSSATALSFGELNNGADVEVHGYERIDSCIEAETVLVLL